MSPYRQAGEADVQDAAKQKRRAELSMFGLRQRPDGEWVPILERVESDPCRDCRGYGTGGNPLCGAVYTCKRCEGSGFDPDPNSLPQKKWYRRLVKWIRDSISNIGLHFWNNPPK